METPEVAGELRYQVKTDRKVLEKYLRLSGRKNYRIWLIYAASQIPLFAAFGAAAFIFGQMFTGAKGWDGIIPALIFGCFCGPIYALWQYENGIKLAIISEMADTWDCELTPSHYQFTDHNGVTTSVPWQQMKMESAEPEYWEIMCGDRCVMVYREPLRKAGLEAEFERRIGQEPISIDATALHEITHPVEKQTESEE